MDRARSAGAGEFDEAIARGAEWCLGLQSRNGGWGAFDADNTFDYLNNLPFADHGALLDPPTEDVSARCLSMLAQLGDDIPPRQAGQENAAVDRAIAYLRRTQLADGSWYGRWGMNYIYGTWSVLCALRAAGMDRAAPEIRKAAKWLEAIQNADGGWGEDGTSYKLDYRGYERASSTASQTAWALMALLAANRPEDREAIERGCTYLVEHQSAGTWAEPQFTGTGFPGYGVGQTIKLTDPSLSERLMQGPELSRAFMLRYGMYCHYFPLMALGRALQPQAHGKAAVPKTAEPHAADAVA